MKLKPITLALLLVCAAFLFACESATPVSNPGEGDGDEADGDMADPDGPSEDGDVSNAPDGDAPDGDGLLPDGDVADGDGEGTADGDTDGDTPDPDNPCGTRPGEDTPCSVAGECDIWYYCDYERGHCRVDEFAIPCKEDSYCRDGYICYRPQDMGEISWQGDYGKCIKLGEGAREQETACFVPPERFGECENESDCPVYHFCFYFDGMCLTDAEAWPCLEDSDCLTFFFCYGSDKEGGIPGKCVDSFNEPDDSEYFCDTDNGDFDCPLYWACSWEGKCFRDRDSGPCVDDSDCYYGGYSCKRQNSGDEEGRCTTFD